MKDLHGCEDPWGAQTATQFVLFAGFSCCLVVFGGIMSGLQQGLMQLDETALVGFSREGSPRQQWMAQTLLPLVRRRHFTLVTLLIANAIAMEALPIFLDVIAPKYAAILISVTLVVFFGEIIPQGLCLKYPFELSANLSFLVYALMALLSPVAYPIAMLLDWMLGHEHQQLFNRAGLWQLMQHHSKQRFNGPLNDDEVNIITGTLEMYDKPAKDIMTPIKRVFMFELDDQLTDDVLLDIYHEGFSRIPVYKKTRSHIVGFVLVKQLIRTPCPIKVSELNISQILDIQPNANVYSVLRLFRSCSCHMARVADHASDQRSIGIITMEDVFEVLLKQQIEDETDLLHAQNKHLDSSIAKLRTLKKSLSSLIATRPGSERSGEESPSVSTGYGSMGTRPSESEHLQLLVSEDHGDTRL